MRRLSSASGTDDIHNLVDTPGVTQLGVIAEDGKGANPDILSPKKVGKHGGLARLTTDEWNE